MPSVCRRSESGVRPFTCCYRDNVWLVLYGILERISLKGFLFVKLNGLDQGPKTLQTLYNYLINKININAFKIKNIFISTMETNLYLKDHLLFLMIFGRSARKSSMVFEE